MKCTTNAALGLGSNLLFFALSFALYSKFRGLVFLVISQHGDIITV